MVLHTFNHGIHAKTKNKVIDLISSGGIKNQLGECAFQTSSEDSLQEYCYIRNTDQNVIRYFQEEQSKTASNCIHFQKSNYNSTTPSIMYSEANGRLGNQLLAYAMLVQLRFV